MVDATIGHEALSFMDGSSGYNQIRMAPEDEEFTAFRTPKGIHYYKVMSFGLKNSGATYQRAIKGQALANFLADHLIPADCELSDDFLDEDVLYTKVLPPWMMFFNRAAQQEESGAGVVFVSPQKQVLPFAFVLSEPCSNNVAEYQALITSLQIALDMKISYLEVYGDSKLMATQRTEKFDGVSLEHIPKNKNRIANALANLATTLALSEGEKANVPVFNCWVLSYMEEYVSETNAISISIVEDEDWPQPLIDYLEHGKLPEDPRHRTEVRQRAPRSIHYKGTLYRRSFDGLFL
ncbi:uncharacterized protein LOC142635160 [Castanea sativa]|uniref:uncharacterized protein LOC142635160 n=1 Tax=Castanea sativa TaxID=21020 RepID=UPI003F649A3A